MNTCSHCRNAKRMIELNRKWKFFNNWNYFSPCLNFEGCIVGKDSQPYHFRCGFRTSARYVRHQNFWFKTMFGRKKRLCLPNISLQPKIWFANRHHLIVNRSIQKTWVIFFEKSGRTKSWKSQFWNLSSFIRIKKLK